MASLGSIWCSGYETQSWAVVAVLATLSAISLALFIVLACYSSRTGCRECLPWQRCCCSLCSNVTKDIELYGRARISPPSSARDNKPLTALIVEDENIIPPGTGWQAADIVRQPVINMSWPLYLGLATRLSLAMYISLEIENGRRSGTMNILLLTQIAELSAVDSIALDIHTRGRRVEGWRRTVSMLTIFLLLGATGVTMASTLTETLRQYPNLNLGLASFALLTSMVTATVMVVRVTQHLKQTTVTQRLAAILLWIVTMGSAGVNVYGATLDADERELSAQSRGCFGDYTTSHTDLVVFMSQILIAAQAVLIIGFSVPECRCSRNDSKRISPTSLF
jgi:hypothetical protein